MKINAKNTFIVTVAYLYVLLFIYAATSKLTDFENFRVQLGQSPLLSAFASWVSWLVIAVEILILTFLLIPKFRKIALYAAFFLMVMFTAYIFIILHYSDFVPCSCGGILEKMGWNEHLFFNLVFVILAMSAILFMRTPDVPRRKVFLPLALLAFTGMAVITGLFIASDTVMQYHNKFQRRFPHFAATAIHQKDLEFNSYYFAGIDNGKIYLGNNTAPLLVTILEGNLRQQSSDFIRLDQKNLNFKSVQFKVSGSNFFLFDGTVPCVYRGETSNWKARLMKTGKHYFSLAVPIDSANIAVRIQKRGSAESMLGVFGLHDTSVVYTNPDLLQKQLDGVFDTDGTLAYSKGLNRFVYLYAYRNEFIIADPASQLDSRGNTIDTISRAKLDIVNLYSRDEKKLGKRPLIVNKNMAVYNNLLFVDSAIPGNYEDMESWKNSSIIDVYDLSKKRYLLSFYIAADAGKKMKAFAVEDDRLYALAGHKLVVYKIGAIVTKYYNGTGSKPVP